MSGEVFFSKEEEKLYGQAISLVIGLANADCKELSPLWTLWQGIHHALLLFEYQTGLIKHGDEMAQMESPEDDKRDD